MNPHSCPPLLFPVQCDTCLRVHAAFALRHEARLKDRGPRKARAPTPTYSRCANVRLSLCRVFILFVVPPFFYLLIYFFCDKHACPPDPPGGLRMAVSHEPF